MKISLATGLACALLPPDLAAAQLEPTRNALDQQHGTPVDTRDSAYFNGWPEAGAGAGVLHGGHEPGAVNLAASWLGKLDM